VLRARALTTLPAVDDLPRPKPQRYDQDLKPATGGQNKLCIILSPARLDFA
jgi:hypothetical protein